MDGRTLVGKVESSAGGVGRNMADCLTRLGANPLLISNAGAQEHAQALFSKMEHMDKSGIKIVEGARTATCIVILDSQGDCLFYIGDMSVHDSLDSHQVKDHEALISEAPLVIIDGNIPLKTMDFVFDLCSHLQVPVWFEPTDLTKAFRPFKASSKWRSVLSYATPNLTELKIMHSAILGKDIPVITGNNSSLDAVLQESLSFGVPLIGDHLHTLFVTLGAQGVLLITSLPTGAPFPTALMPAHTKDSSVRAVYYPAIKMDQVVSVSGAGDCFAAGMIASIVQGLAPEACIQCGQRAATVSLNSHLAVPHTITTKTLFDEETVPEAAAQCIFP